MRYGDGLALPLQRFGDVVLAVQPARGYQIDPKASYHSPDLLPPHHYLLYLAAHEFDAHAVIHLGKHGNSNGCLARPLRCHRRVSLMPFSGRCRIFIRSLSMT